MAQLLVVDDNDAMRDGMAISLRKDGHQVTAARSGIEALAAYRKGAFDFVVTDLKMEPVNGLALLRELREHDPEAAVMVVTAYGSIEIAVEAMQHGATDFITKPFTPEVLRAKVAKGLEHAAAKRQVVKLTAHNEVLQRDARGRFSALVGESDVITRVLEQAKKAAAASDATVFVSGESGTGKELVARMIHDLSPRRNGPFVVVHCASLAETLLESELFGHERGAFTGAIKRKLGRFELADGGTIFLDEIGEISPSVQTKLLRVLQQKEIQRVGGEETVSVDVRVVSATHRNLQAEVAAGRFREDLFYRLHIVPLRLPPLRERPEDIPLLARHFVARSAARVNPKVKGITDAALEALQRYAWPGNVRELENAIEQAMVFAESEVVDVPDLPSFLQANVQRAPIQGLPVPHGDRPLPEILEDLERQLIERAYEKANRVKTETARLLGIKTSALYYKLEKYGFIQKGESTEE